jgi:hypothetical protein
MVDGQDYGNNTKKVSLDHVTDLSSAKYTVCIQVQPSVYDQLVQEGSEDDVDPFGSDSDSKSDSEVDPFGEDVDGDLPQVPPQLLRHRPSFPASCCSIDIPFLPAAIVCYLLSCCDSM